MQARRRAGLAYLLIATVGCGRSSGVSTGTSAGKGQYGLTYSVNVSRPNGGTITSGDGRINCGTAGRSADSCGPALYAWNETVVLTATPDAGQGFGTWAGDCQYRGPCVLDTKTYGADKFVAAVFGPAGEVLHGNFSSPAVHGPEYVKFVAGKPDAFRCSNASCHGSDLNGRGIAPSCNTCHAAAGFPNWRTDCHFCHGFPPSSGAHVAHFGLAGAFPSGVYGDTSILRDRYPLATPTAAPGVYAFGCGSCHPLDASKHMNGGVDVELYDSTAPAGSLKLRAASTAGYDTASGTCSGVYCHSSGQGTPQYVTTPPWTSQARLACNACHANPPRYASGAAGSAAANTHLLLRQPNTMFGNYSYELYGHFTWHNFYAGATTEATGKHGVAGEGAAPMTCQACHYGTVDPASTGPSGFFWLDTTGEYDLPGAAHTYSCRSAGCHTGAPGDPPQASGRVLPLLHVNGVRDVVFDARQAPPSYVGVPSGSYAPVLPYWAYVTRFNDVPALLSAGGGWSQPIPPDNATTGTASFALGGASYDPSTKTCSNVACHLLGTQVQWGGTAIGKYETCYSCHQRH